MWRTDGRTDGQTNWRTDGPTKRGVESRSTRLKKHDLYLKLSINFWIVLLLDKMNSWSQINHIWKSLDYQSGKYCLIHLGVSRGQIVCLFPGVCKLVSYNPHNILLILAALIQFYTGPTLTSRNWDLYNLGWLKLTSNDPRWLKMT